LAEAIIAQQIGATIADLANQDTASRNSVRAVTVVAHSRLVVLGERALENRPMPCESPCALRSATMLVGQAAQRVELAATKRTAISLATSPAACPPMPSATTNPAVRTNEVTVLIPRPDDADVGATCGVMCT